MYKMFAFEKYVYIAYIAEFYGIEPLLSRSVCACTWHICTTTPLPPI